ncbi:hypothetical protein LC612_32210 [Nostoc sp. CHAB 5834]|nr:hypothetical protein [Nostoc sp. CHAB 5834]
MINTLQPLPNNLFLNTFWEQVTPTINPWWKTIVGYEIGQKNSVWSIPKSVKKHRRQLADPADVS